MGKYRCVESDKMPTLHSLKQEIIDWPVNHGVKIDFTLIKSQLLEKVKSYNWKTFIVDEIIRAKDHIDVYKRQGKRYTGGLSVPDRILVTPVLDYY